MPTYHRIRNRHSGNVLTVQSTEVGTQIVQWDENETDNQPLKIRPFPGKGN